MNMFEAIGSGYKNYFNFSGRARRSEYWWFVLSFLLAVALSIAAMIYLAEAHLKDPRITAAAAALCALILLSYIIPIIAMEVRRLHDTNRSGAWILLVFVPFGRIVLLVFFCQEGVRHDNQYGPSPIKLGRARANWDTDPVA